MKETLVNPLNREHIVAFLREKKLFLRKKFGIDAIGLFGSYARDEQTPHSDIDVIIITSIKSFDNRMDLKEFLENHFGKEVDVCYADSMRKFIRQQIEQEVIYA